MNDVVDGQAYPVIVELEAVSQLRVALVENHVPLVVQRGRAQRDGDKVVLA